MTFRKINVNVVVLIKTTLTEKPTNFSGLKQVKAYFSLL